MESLDKLESISGISSDEDIIYKDLKNIDHIMSGAPFSAAKAMFILKEASKIADDLNFNQCWAESVGEVDADAVRYNNEISALGRVPPEEDKDAWDLYRRNYINIRSPKNFQSVLINKLFPGIIELLGELDQNVFRALAIAITPEEELKQAAQDKSLPKKITEKTDWLMFNVPFGSLADILQATFRLMSFQSFFKLLQTNQVETETTGEKTETTDQPAKKRKTKVE